MNRYYLIRYEGVLKFVSSYVIDAFIPCTIIGTFSLSTEFSLDISSLDFISRFINKHMNND